jgi:hypothetical protein
MVYSNNMAASRMRQPYFIEKNLQQKFYIRNLKENF